MNRVLLQAGSLLDSDQVLQLLRAFETQCALRTEIEPETLSLRCTEGVNWTLGTRVEPSETRSFLDIASNRSQSTCNASSGHTQPHFVPIAPACQPQPSQPATFVPPAPKPTSSPTQHVPERTQFRPIKRDAESPSCSPSPPLGLKFSQACANRPVSPEDFQHLQDDNAELRAKLEHLQAKLDHIEAENRLECVVCLEAHCDVLFMPCGHVCCCHDCGDELRLCPQCRTIIDQVVRVYLP